MTTASAPASSANLGPGFDVLALALDLEVSVTLAAGERWQSAELEPEGLAMVQQAAELAVPTIGPHTVSVHGDIPLGRGLGSSAALRVASAAAAMAAVGGGLEPDEVFRAAAAAEGHPDNVAASTYGGLVAVAPEGAVRRLNLHPSFIALVAVPGAVLSTAEARRVLDAEVDRDVAVRTVARTVFLVEGLRTGDVSVLRSVSYDEMHEARRAELSPLTDVLVREARDAGAAFSAWSGAGPSALAFVTEESEEPVRLAWEQVLGDDGEVMAPGVAGRGVVID